jgi:hypothetical protein
MVMIQGMWKRRFMDLLLLVQECNVNRSAAATGSCLTSNLVAIISANKLNESATGVSSLELR